MPQCIVLLFVVQFEFESLCSNLNLNVFVFLLEKNGKLFPLTLLVSSPSGPPLHLSLFLSFSFLPQPRKPRRPTSFTGPAIRPTFSLFPSLPCGTRPSAPSPSPCSNRTPGRVLPRPDVRAWDRTPGCPAVSISSAACALGPHQAAAAVLAPQETLTALPCGALGALRRNAVPLLPVDEFAAQ